MKRLKVKLDFENDVAQIFGVPQNLTCSFFSHFFNSDIYLLYQHLLSGKRSS